MSDETGDWRKYWEQLRGLTANDITLDVIRIAQEIESDPDLETSVIYRTYIDNIFIFALRKGSKELIHALFVKGYSKELMLQNMDRLGGQGAAAERIDFMRGFVANLS